MHLWHVQWNHRNSFLRKVCVFRIVLWMRRGSIPVFVWKPAYTWITSVMHCSNDTPSSSWHTLPLWLMLTSKASSLTMASFKNRGICVIVNSSVLLPESVTGNPELLRWEKVFVFFFRQNFSQKLEKVAQKNWWVLSSNILTKKDFLVIRIIKKKTVSNGQFKRTVNYPLITR